MNFRTPQPIRFVMNFRTPQPIRLVIADDHQVLREGLRRWLEAEPGHKVIGEASDGTEAVKATRQLKPDILLLDLAMPKQNGLEALRDLSMPANATPVRVVLLTACIEEGEIVEALQLGARGVVLLDSATKVLFKAIQTVMAGEYWILREPVSNLVRAIAARGVCDQGIRGPFGCAKVRRMLPN